MGWGRYLLLGDLGQQLDLADQQAEIERLKQQLQARSPAPASSDERLRALRRENDELKLYLAAVIRLLVAKNVASVAEITALVAAIDREDGAEDTKYAGPVIPSA